MVVHRYCRRRQFVLFAVEPSTMCRVADSVVNQIDVVGKLGRLLL